jgi:hypothetical protein
MFVLVALFLSQIQLMLLLRVDAAMMKKYLWFLLLVLLLLKQLLETGKIILQDGRKERV